MGSSKLFLLLLFAISFCTADKFFTSGAIWNQDISNAPLDPYSINTTSWLQANGGWGTSNNFQIDFSMVINRNGLGAPIVQVQQVGYTFPDCDNTTRFPLPNGGAIEGVTGYQCSGGDCHLLVFDSGANIMWESFQSNVASGQLQSTCVVAWNLSEIYPNSGRGDQCTSADAAGFPIAALLWNANEIAAGSINHAIRFILPNTKIQGNVFVHPGTHATRPPGASGPFLAPIYGSRWRLKSTFNLTSLSAPAQVVAKALQKYGMFLSDGGNIALTAESDMFTTSKYANLNFDSHSLFGIQPTDFEVVASSDPVITLTFNCQRNPNVFPNVFGATSGSSGGTTVGTNGRSGSGIALVFNLLIMLAAIVFSMIN